MASLLLFVQTMDTRRGRLTPLVILLFTSCVTANDHPSPPEEALGDGTDPAAEMNGEGPGENPVDERSEPSTEPEGDPGDDPVEEPPVDEPDDEESELLTDSSGPVHVLEAVHETYLKINTEQARDLDEDARCLVAVGQRLLLREAALPTEDGLHFRVRLLEPVDGCPLDEGYLYGEHFTIAEAPTPIDAELRHRVTAVHNTWFKETAAQSSELADHQRCAITAGEVLSLTERPSDGGDGHIRIRLATARTGCGFREGFLFRAHFEVETVIVITATTSTWLKATTGQSSELAAHQKCALSARDLLELAAEPERAANGHFRIELSGPRDGCALRDGYIFGDHFDLGGLALAENPLEAPYYYQYHNRNEPGSTCGITSGAMLMGHYGSRLSPDDLYRRYGKHQGQSPIGLATIYRRELGYGTGTYTGSRSQIRRHIDAGRPVVIHGNFTGSGHVVLIVGYDDTGWILHDPAGRWAGCYRCGYPSRTSTNGRFVHYSYGSMSASVMGAEGSVWMSVGSTGPIDL